MTKLIKSQDGQSLHYLSTNTTHHFSIARVLGGYSLGIDTMRIGLFTEEATAERALRKLEAFLLAAKAMHYQVPLDEPIDEIIVDE